MVYLFVYLFIRGGFWFIYLFIYPLPPKKNHFLIKYLSALTLFSFYALFLCVLGKQTAILLLTRRGVGGFLGCRTVRTIIRKESQTQRISGSLSE